MRLRGWPLAVIVSVVVVLHFLLHVGLGIGRAAPDLLVVVTLLVGRRTTGSRALALGALLGLVEDATGFQSLGARAVGLGIAGYAASRSRRFLTGDGIGFTPVYIFAGSWLSLALTRALRHSSGGTPAEMLLAISLDAAWAAVAGTVIARWLPAEGRNGL